MADGRDLVGHLGHLASDIDESTGLVRGRVALLTGFIVGISGVLWVGNAALNAVFFPDFEPGSVASPRSLLHGFSILALAALWVWVRRPTHSYRAARGADWVAMLILGGVVGGMVVLSDAPYRPELVMSLALGHSLVLRAAIVPSTWKTTAVLGVVVEAPMVLAAWYVHSRNPVLSGFLTPAGAAAAAALWAGLTVAVTSLISHVIYGLQERVRAAMQLGQYVLEEKLGEGGMGVVYRARHSMLRRPTAVKLLLAGRAQRRDVLRFEKEVQLTAGLSHPHIVAVHDFGRTAEGVFYYAMEYIDGLDLESLVRVDGPQPPGRVRHLLRQVASALAEAHRIGLIHRDIKPANVMVSEGSLDKDWVKLLDFGLVKDLSEGRSDLTDIGALRGTPLYVSPEAICSPQSVDTRSDIYSFGATGYFLLVGKPVFDAESVVEVCAQHLHQDPVPPSERLGEPIPDALEELILRCLSKAPEQRPSSAVELVTLLDGLDGCPAWTMDDAGRWWEQKAPEVRARSRRDESSPQVARRLAIDVRQR